MFNVTFIQPPFNIIAPFARVAHTTRSIKHANLIKPFIASIRILVFHNANLETVTERSPRLDAPVLYIFKF